MAALVAGPREQLTVTEDGGADRHVAVRLGVARLFERDLHPGIQAARVHDP